MSNVLISGGSGMIGQKLSSMLLDRNYKVAILSRSNRSMPNISTFEWDVKGGTINEEAILKADHIIHLAGAGIADQRWTEERKKEIYDSRILSTRLLVNKLSQLDHNVKTFVSTSAVGIYGNSQDQMMTESSPPSDNFLAKVCVDWESEAKRLNATKVRLVIPRIGIVLSTEGGALTELQKTLPFGFISYLGDGQQYYSWIHIEDLCRMIIEMIEHPKLQGVYNAVAPNPVRNKELVKQILNVRGKRAIVLPAPALALKLALGEMSNMILETQRCAASKIQESGFKFNYPLIEGALAELYPS